MTKPKTEMTRAERKNKEWEDIQERKAKEMEEIQQQLKDALNFDEITVLSVKESDEEWDLQIAFQFTLDGYTQEDYNFWNSSESIKDFTQKIKNQIDYIREMREQYPEYCKQNDFIQTNSVFDKTLVLTHMGYERRFDFHVALADYMKLPNTTSCSFGGGDYQIKRTPKRVKEYNQNIDKTIHFLIDCIAELQNRRFKGEGPS